MKLRGHRIELEAVEAVINESPAVDACAVVVERGEEDRLVALVAPAPNDQDRATVLELLRRRLPRYSVPAEIIGVAALPRTGVGKVDRAAAAAMLARRRTDDEQTVASPEPLG